MGGYIGARAGSLSITTVANAQDITATDTTPEVTIINNTHEDTDGGREGKVIFKGQQSGGEETTLAEIQGSHDGTADDEKGDLIFKTNDGSDNNAPTEAMRIDSAQTIGIGTAAPSPTGLAIVTGGGSKGVMLTRNDGSGNPTSGQGFGSFGFKGIMDGTNSMAAAEASIEAIAAENHSGSTAATSLAFYTKASGTGPGSGPTERMRLNDAGNLLLGTSTVQGQGHTFTFGGTYPQYNIVAGVTTSLQVIQFRNPNGKIGTIVMDGSSTTYNTSSDYRLKENVTNISDGITRVKQLAPKRFNFIADADKTVDGFLAHEAATVVPEAITGTKDEVDDNGDAVMQGIDQSKLVPLLTAALQEAIAKIETLETKVAALEAE